MNREQKTEKRKNPVTEMDSQVKISTYSKDNWIILECLETGMVWLQNPPDYSQFIEEFAWEKQFAEEKANRKAREPIISFISEMIKKLRRAWRKNEKIETVSENILEKILNEFGDTIKLTIVDVGCGTGNKLFRIVSHIRIKYQATIKAIGIEISQSQSIEANRCLEKLGGICIQNSAIEGLKEMENGSIDFIILCSFLEHEINPLPLLIACKEKLSKRGKIVIKVPNYACLNRIIRQKRWCGFRYPDHVNYFTPKTLRLIIENSGMKIDTLDTFPINDNMWAIVSNS